MKIKNLIGIVLAVAVLVVGLAYMNEHMVRVKIIWHNVDKPEFWPFGGNITIDQTKIETKYITGEKIYEKREVFEIEATGEAMVLAREGTSTHVDFR